MTKPVVFLDPHWRGMDELFSAKARARLLDQCEVIWGQDAKAPEDALTQVLDRVEVIVATEPQVDAGLLARAPRLRMVVEVSGAFPDTIDYRACAARNVDVLSCAPGFQQSVAEMALAMILASGRGLVTQHERFRRGDEQWLADNDSSDFTLFGADVGFVGFGAIAQATARVMAPFSPVLRAFDPWLPDHVAKAHGVTMMSLEDVARHSRCLVVAAVPTRENAGMVNARVFDLMPKAALMVLISRAHLVDFDALTQAVASGHIRAAVDVFPQEPVPQDAELRTLPGLLLSPHRAAAIAGGRHLIGDMLLDDIAAMSAGQDTRRLARADPDKIDALAGVGDAASVADMAEKR